MTCKVRRDFKIIPDELSRVSLVTSNIRRSSICSPKSLYKKTCNEILAELKAALKTGESKLPRPRPVLPSLLWQACVNSQLSPTPPSPPRGREKDATKMNFSSCSDHSWIINDCCIFFLYLRVWIFLFLRTSFFTAQNVYHTEYLVQGLIFLFLFFFSFTLWSARTVKSTIRHVLFFLLIITRSGRLTEIRWSACISKYQKSLCVSFSNTYSRLRIYHLLV